MGDLPDLHCLNAGRWAVLRTLYRERGVVLAGLWGALARGAGTVVRRALVQGGVWHKAGGQRCVLEDVLLPVSVAGSLDWFGP